MKWWLGVWMAISLLFGQAGDLWSSPQGVYYGAVSTTRARPISMGGAFMAIEDDLPAIGYNPGAFSLYRSPRSHRLTLFLNAVGPVVAARDWDTLVRDRSLDAQEVLGLVGLLVKGAAFSAGALDIGVLFGEQALLRPEDVPQADILDPAQLLDHQSSWAIIRVKPADRVALGVSGSLVTSGRQGEARHGFSVSYGIWLHPARSVQIGVSYLSLSGKVTRVRMPLERLQNDSVNLGVALRPTSTTVLAIDLRSVGEQQDQILSQTHFGIEQTIFSQVAVRGGFYDRPGKDSYVITGGIGLLGSDTFFGPDRHFGHPSFMFNYAFAVAVRGAVRDRWHLLSLILRI